MEKNKNKIEIYTLEWCPYCRKAKSFFKSKGLSYVEYDIDDPEIKEEMKTRTNGSKTVPQIIINDQSIGGYDDLINLDSDQLKDLLDIDESEYYQKNWDLVIIGAGPAGLNAAIYAARKGLETLILSVDMGGKVIETDMIENYLGIKNINGPDLIQSFWEHVQEYDVNVKLGSRVTNIITDNEHKIIKTENEKEIKARAVIIASGTHQRQLGIPGEKELKGHGVHYCAICDGYLYAGDKVAVVGGGNSGLEAALDMAKLDSEVVLIEFADQLGGDDVLKQEVYKNNQIDVYTSCGVEKIQGAEQVEGIVARDRDTGKYREVDLQAVFVEIGLVPNSGFVEQLVATNQRNEIIVNDNNRTNVEGIWAAGDVTNIKDKQIIVSAAEGAKTALRVNEYLQVNSKE
jgi:alkyl hydroperoxide reductase subunit F